MSAQGGSSLRRLASIAHLEQQEDSKINDFVRDRVFHKSIDTNGTNIILNMHSSNLVFQGHSKNYGDFNLGLGIHVLSTNILIY